MTHKDDLREMAYQAVQNLLNTQENFSILSDVNFTCGNNPLIECNRKNTVYMHLWRRKPFLSDKTFSIKTGIISVLFKMNIQKSIKLLLKLLQVML